MEDTKACEGKSNCPDKAMIMVSTSGMKRPKWLCETHYQEVVMARKKAKNG